MAEHPHDLARRMVPDILDAMHAILSFTDGMTYAEFEADLKTQYAVHYAFGIIGEVAKPVPREIQRLAPDVDWRGMAGMRDFLVHSYDHVSPGMVWQSMADRFPIERPALIQLIADLDG